MKLTDFKIDIREDEENHSTKLCSNDKIGSNDQVNFDSLPHVATN